MGSLKLKEKDNAKKINPCNDNLYPCSLQEVSAEKHTLTTKGPPPEHGTLKSLPCLYVNLPPDSIRTCKLIAIAFIAMLLHISRLSGKCDTREVDFLLRVSQNTNQVLVGVLIGRLRDQCSPGLIYVADRL